MVTNTITIEVELSTTALLETVVTVLRNHPRDEYYMLEREQMWYLGVGTYASMTIDAKGETVTYRTDNGVKSSPVTGDITVLARQFTQQYAGHHGMIYGHVGFNYGAHIRGQEYQPGEWPLLNLMAPMKEFILQEKSIVITGYSQGSKAKLSDLLRDPAVPRPSRRLDVDINENADEYKTRVAAAIQEIVEGKYTKVIASRAVELKEKIDMPSTLLYGRIQNKPERTFSFRHGGFEATGFSPEYVMERVGTDINTQALAGTRSCKGTAEEVAKLRNELVNDPKEIVEHAMSVKEAFEEMTRFCKDETVVIDDYMTVHERGPVQHLGSRVNGTLDYGKDSWDAFNVLFPAITASGIPKNAALQAIQRLETRPRELYSGAVLMIEDHEFFEAALVLRSVFQDKNRSWIQVGAGIIAQSNPERELTETMEKLASIAPFLVAAEVNAST